MALWAAAGKVATFWWRDDDAVDVTPALDRLLDLAAALGVAPAIAAIPARADAALAGRLSQARRDGVDVMALQHGYAHINHNATWKSELAAGRTLAQRIDELRRGHEQMAALFGALALPVLVPPWNRIGDDLVGRLRGIGIGGLSVYRARSRAWPYPGLLQCNSHVDIIDWRRGKGFIGTASALHLVVDHLVRRRLNHVDGREPTGILTHHLVHDELSWSFLREFLIRTGRHPAVSWLAPSRIFRTA
ncbi:MAG: hypothetical protein FJX52_06570 [Alphaproteobacteria bacterium]|nr:hypothetical protein [Alphaproteobacteria bacterium]